MCIQKPEATAFYLLFDQMKSRNRSFTLRLNEKTVDYIRDFTFNHVSVSHGCLDNPSLYYLLRSSAGGERADNYICINDDSFYAHV